MAEAIELKDRARQWYLENPLANLRDVSDRFEVPYETVRDWSKTEGWSFMRAMQDTDASESTIAQAAGMRRVIFEEVVGGNVASSEIPSMVKAWMSLLPVRGPTEKEETFDRDSLLA